jgi:pimeloyl-ACP methyl ester carboxylesterase
VLRLRECYDPPVAVRREILSARPAEVESGYGLDGAANGDGRPPVLLVPGLRNAASGYARHWLDHVAGRGFPGYAMSPRGQGASQSARGADLRAYAHDVVQVASGLPRQTVLVGHGVGATVVAMAMSRYPVRAGVLVAPVFPGFGQALTYLTRGGKAPRRVRWQLLRGVAVERPVGDPPVLVLGTPDDRLVPRAALDRVAGRYGGAPLLFPGMRHDLMLDPRWQEPIDAICDWLDQLPGHGPA